MTVLKLTYNLPIAFGLEIKFPIKPQDFSNLENSLENLFSTFMRQSKILPLKKFGVKAKISSNEIFLWKRKGYYFSPQISPVLTINKSGVLVLQAFGATNSVNFYPFDEDFREMYRGNSSFHKMWKILNPEESACEKIMPAEAIGCVV